MKSRIIKFFKMSTKEKRSCIKRKMAWSFYPIADKFRYSLVKLKNKFLSPKYQCFICKNQFYSYYPSDMTYLKIREAESEVKMKSKNIISQYRCPYCDSLNRKRMLFLYLEPFMDGFTDILYMSPSASGLNYVSNRIPNAKIISNDKYVDSCDYHYDIEDMNGFADNSFDLIICSHILEHVNNDINALKEIYRVLRPGGMAAVIVPIMLKGDAIDEDTTLSCKDNWIRFGDSTHVRAYSKDGMFRRIKNLGFDVKKIEKNDFEKNMQDINAMLDSDCIYIISK